MSWFLSLRPITLVGQDPEPSGCGWPLYPLRTRAWHGTNVSVPIAESRALAKWDAVWIRRLYATVVHSYVYDLFGRVNVCRGVCTQNEALVEMK